MGAEALVARGKGKTGSQRQGAWAEDMVMNIDDSGQKRVATKGLMIIRANLHFGSHTRNHAI